MEFTQSVGGVLSVCAGIIILVINKWLVRKTSNFYDSHPELGFSGVYNGKFGRFIYIISGIIVIAWGIILISGII